MVKRGGWGLAVGVDYALLDACCLLWLSGTLWSGLALGSQSTNPLLLALLRLVASVAWAAVAVIGSVDAAASIASAAWVAPWRC